MYIHGRITQLCERSCVVGDRVLVTATPFASYCPEVFLNSVLTGHVSKLLNHSGDVFLIDASVVSGCEGGMIVHGHYSR